jgi:hypothetical protein
MRSNLVQIVTRAIVVMGALLIGACSGGGSNAGGGPDTHTVGGSVSGLQGTGLVLQDNLGNDLPIVSGGTFVFTTAIAAGGAYSVTVKTQPTNAWQTCTVSGGSGTVAAANITGVVVTCVTNTYSVGGAISGLAGVGLVLQDNATDDLGAGASSAFTFPTKIASGKAYAVTVKSQPTSPSQTCTPTTASGTITNAAVTNVAVTCITNTYSVGGTVTGLVGTGMILEDNSAGDLTISGNGGFTFATAIASGSTYNVTVLTQPGGPTQACSVSSASGTVTNGAVTTVAVNCAPPVTACGTPNGTVVQHASNVVADETWAGAGTVHIVASTISVLAPATLTIQKCAIVRLGAGAQIVVRGGTAAGSIATLLADGDDPATGVVYFASNDANQRWGSLEGSNANSYIQLNNAQLAGGGATTAGTRNATIEMHGTSNSTLPDPVLKVNTVIISDMQGAGVYLDNAAFTTDSQFLAISNSPDYAMAMSAMALGSIPSYIGTANAHDEALVVGNANIFADMTVHKRLPIHFHTTGVRVAGGPPSFVPTVTLTLDAGVVFRFENIAGTPTMMTFGTNGQSQDQNGVLIANGNPFDPVIFTTGLDTPPALDTDYWAGIWLLTSNGSQLQNVVFEYAGGDASIGPVNCGPFDPSINQQARHTAPLLVGDGTDQQYIPPASLITGSTFRNNIGNFAIDSVWENSTRTFGPSLHNDNTFTSPGKFCPQSKNLIPLGCTIAGVDQSGCQ